MKRFTHLSLEEREKLYGGLKEGLSLRAIGRQMGRDHTSLSDELKRNRYMRPTLDHPYLPCRAQEISDRRAREQRTKAPLKTLTTWLYVREHLRPPFNWSPEQIAGRLTRDHPGESIDDETIYRYVHGIGKKYHLQQFLPLKRRRRMKRNGRRVGRRGHIPEAVSIEKRPLIVDKRKQIGHWESDNVIGRVSDTHALSTTVERVTRLTVLSRITRTADGKSSTLIQRLSLLPRLLLRTMTVDNGLENVRHKQITQQLSAAVYFCHAYSSWEKGAVENMNGRIRRYIPKGVSIDTVSDKHVAMIEYRLNNTPRKCLGYMTPHEKMNEALREIKEG